MTRDDFELCHRSRCGGDEDSNMETIIYAKLLCPRGTAIMIERLSDNRNRTVSEASCFQQVRW